MFKNLYTPRAGRFGNRFEAQIIAHFCSKNNRRAACVHYSYIPRGPIHSSVADVRFTSRLLTQCHGTGDESEEMNNASEKNI